MKLKWLERLFKGKSKMEETKYIPKRDKVKAERFTNDELMELMPKHDRINRKYIKGAIDFIMEKMPFYQDIDGYIKQCCSETFPHPTREQYKNHDEYVEEYHKYFYVDDYYNFIHCVQSEYLNRKGVRRPYEEACQIAADKWVSMIFGTHVQDNGDRTGYSDMAMMLGTLVKEETMDRCDKDVSEKARELLYQYYLSGCIYKSDSGHEFKCEPYSDYGPNSPLYDILIKAGVNKKDAGSITPWKTGIEIDENDNTVVLQGYQKLDYI